MILDLNRIRLAFVVLGFCLALGGVVLDNRALTWSAMTSLIAALALRLFLRRRDASDQQSEEGPSGATHEGTESPKTLADP